MSSMGVRDTDEGRHAVQGFQIFTFDELEGTGKRRRRMPLSGQG